MAGKPRGRPSEFSLKWGIRIEDLAAEDGVTCESIYMRIKNFGSPFQRKRKPTKFERKYCKTLYEISMEKGAHPVTVLQKEGRLGHIDFDIDTSHRRDDPDNPEQYKWTTLKRYGAQPWLHERHPDYERWRSGEMFRE